MKLSNNDDNRMTIKGIQLAFKYDAKAKEERIRCARENIIESVSFVGNTSLQSEKEILEKFCIRS